MRNNKWYMENKQSNKLFYSVFKFKFSNKYFNDHYSLIQKDLFYFIFQKSDPTQFLQLHGRPCKIHLDPVIAAAGDSPANM